MARMHQGKIPRVIWIQHEKVNNRAKRSVLYLHLKYYIGHWRSLYLYIYNCMPPWSQFLHIFKASSLRSIIKLCEVCLLSFQLNILNMLLWKFILIEQSKYLKNKGLVVITIWSSKVFFKSSKSYFSTKDLLAIHL